jgi:hypothetical protein
MQKLHLYSLSQLLPLRDPRPPGPQRSTIAIEIWTLGRPPNLPGTACRSLCPNASSRRSHPASDQLGRHSTCARTLKIVKLLTFKAADMNAFAVDYIAVHDRPPLEAPQQRLRFLAGDSETNCALELFPLRLQAGASRLRRNSRTRSILSHRLQRY